MPEIEWVGADGGNYSLGRDGQTAIAVVNHLMMGTYAGTAAWFHNPSAQVSAHFAIDAAGKIYQFIHLADTAYANGFVRQPNVAAVPWIEDLCLLHRINPNKLTVSIEWEGAHQGLTAQSVPYKGVVLETLRASSTALYWKPTTPQYAAGVALNGWLAATLGIALDRAHITRHSDYDSITRWYCPGGAFPMADLIHALGGKV